MTSLIFVRVQGSLRALAVESRDIINDFSDLAQWGVSDNEKKLKGSLQKMTVRH